MMKPFSSFIPSYCTIKFAMIPLRQIVLLAVFLAIAGAVEQCPAQPLGNDLYSYTYTYTCTYTYTYLYSLSSNLWKSRKFEYQFG